MTMQQSSNDDNSSEVKEWLADHPEAADHNPVTYEVFNEGVLDSDDVVVTITTRSDNKLVLDFDFDDEDIENLALNGLTAAARGAVLTTPDYTHEVEDQWTEGQGETHAIYAELTITDQTTGDSWEAKVRNAVDIGWQVFPNEYSDGDALPDPVQDYVRENSPITTSHRQFGWER